MKRACRFILFQMMCFLMLGGLASAQSPGHTSVPDCHIGAELLTENLQLDFQNFDQQMTGGWRALAQRGCYFEAGLLIDEYHIHHLKTLLPWQSRVLYWHAGQLFAYANANLIAVSRFEISVDPAETANDTFKWNSYVEASIAFLKGERDLLLLHREVLAKATEPHAANNLKIVDHMIQCFGRPYSVAYDLSAVCD